MTQFKVPPYRHPFSLAGESIANALVDLLEHKHLYQYVLVSTDSVLERLMESDEGTSIAVAMDNAKRETTEIFHRPWSVFIPPRPTPAPPGSNCIQVEAQTIKIPCSCGAVYPAHNPGYRHAEGQPPTLELPPTQSRSQLFVIPFQCQSCKGEPIVFMVRREGLKLTLVGRSQFEAVQVPKWIPKVVAKYYSSAVISHQCGHTLAGLLYLRTLIEQHMRSEAPTDPPARSGDEMAAAYGKTLSPEFNSKYASFGSIYDKLSNAIHTATEDGTLFETSLREISEHLEARPYFPKPSRTAD